MPRLSAFSLALILALAAGSVFADWSHWRGPARDGDAGPTGFPPGSVTMEVLWNQELGSGYSSVSVVADLAVTAATIGDADWVVAFDAATGRKRWRYRLGDAFRGRSGSDDGPMATPALAAGKVVAVSGEGSLVVLDATSGRELWKRDLVADDEARVEVYGYSAAPLVDGDTVIVQLGSESAMLAAFALEDGTSLWRSAGALATHHNPSIVELAGRRQVVASGVTSVHGFDVTDGSTLWSLDLEDHSESGEIVPLGTDRVLVTRWSDVHAIEVTVAGEAMTAALVWSSNSLGNTYAVPVVRDGYLYGLKRGFLTCVDAATGEVVWRSRPPGGNTIVAAGGSLFLLTTDGELVGVEATADGYRETGRADLFDTGSVHTPASASGGRLFVRNLHSIAAVAVAPGQALAATGESIAPPAGSVLAGLASDLAGEGGASAVDAFLDRHPVSPILDGEHVHFVYRGDVEDLALLGDMTGGNTEEVMHRLGDSDLFFRSYPLPAGERWEYTLREFDRGFPDPRNPDRVGAEGRERSVVRFPGWSDLETAAEAAGEFAEHTLPAESEDGDELALTIYSPAAAGDGPLPMLVWFDGRGAQSDGRIPQTLDRLAAEGLAVRAVFLRLPGNYAWEVGLDALRAALRDRILPLLDAHYPASGSRFLVAQGWTAEVALPVALELGFSGLALQSPVIGSPRPEARVREAAPGVDEFALWVDYGRFDTTYPVQGWSASGAAGDLESLFSELGFRATRLETGGGANWTRWRGATPALVRSLAGNE